MTTIADLSVKIAADITGLQTGLTQANNSLGGFARSAGEKFNAMKAGMDSFVSGMAPLSAILGVGLGAGIKIASDFEGVMAEIGARAQLTAADMGMVSDFALQMGADTAFSGQQAGEALLSLLSGGQNVQQAMATLPAVLDAAAASGVDLGTTADGVTDILSIFGLEAADAAAVVDSLAKASGASKAEIGDMIEAMRNGGSAAAAFGIDQNKTNAILTAFAARGKTGAEAGTLLKSMLENMSRNTKDVKAAWADLGTSMYDAEGNARDFGVVIEEIKLGLAGMTLEEQNATLQDLAGTFGIAGIRALTSGQSIAELEAAMAGSAGASEVAGARMDTFAGRMDSLKGSVETLMIQALTPLLQNVLQPMVEKLTPIINSMTEWAAKNPQVMTGILLVAGGIAIATPFVWALSVAMGAVGTAMTLLTGPIGLIILGIGALIGGVVLWNTKITDTLTGGEAAWMGFAISVEDVVRRFQIMFIDLEIGAQTAIGAMKDALGDDAGGMAARVRINELVVKKGAFSVGDALYAALIDGTGDFRNGLPFTLPDDLVMQIQANPDALADNLSLPTKALMIEAWNAAVAAGDMEFIADALPLMVAIDEGGLVPTWGGDLDVGAVKTLILEELQTAIDAGDDQAMIKWQTLGIEAGITPATMEGMWDYSQIKPALQANLQTALDAMIVTGWLDLSTIEIATGDNVIDFSTGQMTPQVIPLDTLLTFDSDALADMVADAGPGLVDTVKQALRQVLLVGDSNQQGQVMNLARMIGIDANTFKMDFADQASELDLGGDVTRTIIEAMNEGDRETIEFIVPLLPILEYDENLVYTALMKAGSNFAESGDLNGTEVVATVNIGLRAASDARIRADAATAVTTATAGLDVPIDTTVSPRVTVPGSFRSNVAGLLAGQIEGMSIQANVHVVAMVTGATPPPVDGSHASGLDYVPFDNYVGNLHRGEAVLTASQASEWRGGRGGQASAQNTFNLHSYGQSPQEFAEWIRRLMAEGSY